MRCRTAALAALLIAVAAPAQAQRLTSDTALASLVRAERAFAQNSLRGGTQQAFLRFMSPTSYLYRPRVVGAQAYLRNRPMPAGLALAWEPAFADVSAAGDLGYTTGPWISSRRDMPDAPPTFGEHVTIWRRAANGVWRAEINLGVAHDPDPVGPTGVTAAAAPEYRTASRDTAAHLRSLLAADSAFDAAARAQGAATAFNARKASTMRLLRMGRFPLTGDSAINVLRATPAYRWKPVGGAVSRSGDLGYTFGVYSTTQASPRGGETGDYLRIFRRDRAGNWRVVLDATSPAT